MNKEQLQKKYADEKVFCVRQRLLDQWFKVEKQPVKALFNAMSLHGFFDYRYNAEINFDAKQVIPYVVTYNKDKTKIYVVERLGGDPRLVGQIAIGLGGHINPIDMAERNIFKTVDNNVFREMKEETTCDSIEEVEYKTVFVDETNEVSKVHICLLTTCVVEEEGFEIKESEKLKGSWVDIETIRNNFEKMESWASIAFKILHGVNVEETQYEEEVVVEKTEAVPTHESNGDGQSTKKHTNKKHTKTKRTM